MIKTGQKYHRIDFSFGFRQSFFHKILPFTNFDALYIWPEFVFQIYNSIIHDNT